MTAKYDKFVAALRALCAEHQVQIAAGDCGTWMIWDTEETGPFAGNAFHQDIMPEDCTKEND